MVLHFTQQLHQALQEIEFIEHQEWIVHEPEEERTYNISDEILGKYGDCKWAIVDLLNQKYGSALGSQFNLALNGKFDLYNWINKNKQDEVAYFLNEAGSNCLNYSEFKAPYKFHLWLGEKGFIIGLEQKGKGFNAEAVHQQKIKENEGAAFEFFRECNSKIFFDDSVNAKIIYLQFLPHLF